MNLANNTKWANVLTALASILAVAQTFLSANLFTPETVQIAGAVLVYLTLLVTTWKQYLSPEVSNTGGQVTIWLAVIATLTGLGDLLNVFHFTPHTGQLIRWAITFLAAIVSIISKQLFPSADQKDKMADLKMQS